MFVLSIWVFLYGIVFYFAEKLSDIIGTYHIVTVFITSFYLLLLFFFLSKKHKLKIYGICIPNHMKEVVVFLAFLLIIPIINIWFYDSCTFEAQIWWHGLIYALMILYSSFLEELLFRGTLPVMMKEKYGISQKTSTIISNAIFAVLHIGSLHNTDGLCVWIRIFTAFSIGLFFSSVKDRTRSIFPGFIFHFLINISYSDYGYAASVYQPILLILASLYFIYDIYFYLTEEVVK